ncbi:MAG TPA: peptide ABC transporter substrate-binding protein [Chloroflexia bacterium]|nr:peptide ABC transporter substrate-binding protein [Chloroflexia bacterium]
MRGRTLKADIASIAFSTCMIVPGLIAVPVDATLAAPAHAQASARVINGIEVAGRFLDVWSKQGSERDSVYVNGLPITARRPEISIEDGKLYDTQWFERARYELHPTSKAPNDVLLGRLGASRVEGRGNKIDPATGKAANPGDEPFVGIDQPADLSASKLWFPETRHTLSGKLLEYWNRYGGLPQFGFPLSEPFEEVSQADGKPYTVQYFERNRMELHPEKPAPYDVELGLLGVEQYSMTAVPAEALPIAPPKDVKSTKDEIIVGMSQEPYSLTLFDNSVAGRGIKSLIEDQLVGRDENDNLFPLNAWYVPTLENGGAQFIGEGEDRYLQVKYKLRQGIKWSDGVELTSNDAIFAYRLILNPDVEAPNRNEYLRLQNVDNPGKYTIIYNYRSYKQAKALVNNLPAATQGTYSFLDPFISLKKPVISRMYSEVGAIYPEHVLGKIPTTKLREDPVSGSPVGTGPYKVESWNREQQLVLVPNEHYSLTAKPLIKRLRIKFIVEFYSGLSQFKTGQIDMFTSESFNSPVADVAGLKAAGYSMPTRPGPIWEHLDFRFDYGPFKERAVREAIFRAINRQRIIDIVYLGTGGVMNSVVPPSIYYSLDNPDFAMNFPDIAAKYKLPIYPYDPERARQVLEEAGWKVGPDGIRAKGGVKLSFIYGTTTQAARQQMQALVAADLKAVGVEAIVKSYPSDIFFDNSADSPRANGTIKLSQFAWSTTRDGDFVLQRGCYNPATSYELKHDPNYCNQKLDEAHTKFNSEAELHVQVEAAAQVQAIFMQDIVVVPLVQRPNVAVVRNTLTNYKLPSGTTSNFWNARQWYFRQP